MDITLRGHRGFLSPTSTSFQFGLLQRNQWVGEERLLQSKDEPIGYSIIAKTNVKGFVITRAEAQKKFTKELMDFIGKLAEQRYMWIRERINILGLTSIKIANMDPSETNYDEILAEIINKFPAATPNVLINIRKKNILKKALNISPMRIRKCEVKNHIHSSTQRNSPLKPNSFLISQLDIPSSRTKTLSPDGLSKPQLNNRNLDSSLFHNMTNTTSLSKQNFCSAQMSSQTTLKTFKLPEILTKSHVSSMHLATSTPREIQGIIYSPIFPIGCNKKRFPSVLEYRNKSNVKRPNEKLSDELIKELKKKNLNKYMVGKRIINLLEDFQEKPMSPNPFEKMMKKRAFGKFY